MAARLVNRESRARPCPSALSGNGAWLLQQRLRVAAAFPAFPVSEAPARLGRLQMRKPHLGVAGADAHRSR
ncbi:hypothetical protein [Martelella sp. HB161492]|uniref:hypothetical protein n=1 Tax=Martelella sp. HB161492 TaxID=2720726 RepID=UPI0015915F9A|nr:hypothetical protein [Martelella sp. HB161492]